MDKVVSNAHFICNWCIIRCTPFIIAIIFSSASTDEESEVYSYHTVVLDCAPIVFVDSTGVTALEQV